jgi:hypothetical protein
VSKNDFTSETKAERIARARTHHKFPEDRQIEADVRQKAYDAVHGTREQRIGAAKAKSNKATASH